MSLATNLTEALLSNVTSPSPLAPLNPDQRHIGLTGSAFVVVLYTNLVLCAVGAVMWLLICSRMDLYQRKHAPKHSASPLPETAPWQARLQATLFCTDWFRDVASAYGLETGIYLLFQKYIVLIVSVVAVLCNAILLPVHLTGSEIKDMTVRFHHDNRTVVEVVEDNFFRASQLTNAMSDSHRLMAHVFVAYAVLVAIYALLRQYVRTVRAVDGREPLACLESYTFRINNVPKSLTIHDLPDLLRAIKDQLRSERVTLHLAFDVHQRVAMGQQLTTVDRRLFNATQAVEERGVHYHICNCMGGCKMQESREYYLQRKEELCLAINEWETQVEQDCRIVKCAGFGHVVVDSPATLAHALTTKLHFEDRFLTSVPCSHPMDIMWQYVGIKREEKVLRRGLVWTFMAFWLVFFSTPVSILSSLQNVLTQSDAINAVLESLPTSSYFYQYLPSLALLGVTLALPSTIEFLTGMERRPSRRMHKRVVTFRIYLYLIISVFVLPSLVLSTVNQLLAHVKSNQGIEGVVRSSFMAGDGSVFINYVVQLMTFGNIGDLYRFYDLGLHVKYVVVTRVARLRPVEKFADQDEFEFAWQYPIILVLFTIVLTYSFFTPWLSVPGLVYFGVKYTIQCDHLCTNLYNNVDSMDKNEITDTVQSLLKYIFNSVLLAQGFLALYFFFTDFYVHSFLLVILMGGTMTCSTWLTDLNKTLGRLATEQAAAAADEENQTQTSSETSDRHLVRNTETFDGDLSAVDWNAFATPHLRQILDKQSIFI